MAEITADRVYETSTTTGTGSYTLAGAIAGHRAFSSVCSNGDTVRCFVEEVDANGVPNGGWEVGIYTWGTGGVLARTTIETSSNSNAAVSWSAGTRRIGLGVTASKLASLGGGGLSNFTEAANSSSPNTSVPVVSLAATNAASDVDVALCPKGAGGIAAQVADASAAGGNKRGSMSVDWQMSRSNNQYVASGDRSVIGGGRDNRANGAQATIPGGRQNYASGNWSTASGYSCEASSEGAVSMGSQNTATGGIGAAAFGRLNSATGDGVFVAGWFNVVDGSYATAFGLQAATRSMQGAFARAAGSFSSAGDAQARSAVLRCATNTATTTRLTADGAGASTANQMTLPSGSAMRFRGNVVARNSSNGDSASWSIVGLAKNISGTVSLVGTPTVSQDFADTGAASWSVAVVADTGNAAVGFNATGAASTNIKWVVDIDSVEVVG